VPEAPRAALLATAACVIAFCAIALAVFAGSTLPALDEQVSAWLAARRSPAWNRIMGSVSDAHATLPLLAAAFVVAAWLRVRGWREQALRLAVLVPLAMVVNVALKQVFARVRPSSDLALVHLSTYSFPSGHTTASAVFYGLLCMAVFARTQSRAVRRGAVIAAGAMVSWVALSRVYLAAHYPSDVLASLCVAGVVLLVAGWRRPARVRSG